MVQTTAPAWAAGLNAEQRRAVEHDGGPLLVVAGAGTGKTRMLVSRLARLLDGGVPPERILLVTFSRRAAAELVRRAGQLADPSAARRVQAGTFHSVAHQVLRRHGAALGLGEGWSVLDQGDARDLFALVRQPVAQRQGRRFPRTETVAAVYARVVSTQVPLEQTVARTFPWCSDDLEGLRAVFTAYTARKREQHLLDFEDLLLCWRAAVLDPVTGPALAAAYDHVLVDEYQDTCVVQSDILRALRAADPRITVVGDDAQAIYSFRAATVRNILDFPAHFPGTTVVTLEQNYRSTGPVLALANAVIAEAGEGHRKQLWTAEPGGVRPVLATCPDQQAQAEAVAESILEHYEAGVALREQAVLFRSAHHSDLLEVELRRRRIPFHKFGGLRFLEAAHVRDLLALLRLPDNPWDELAWNRVLLLADGVGPAAARRIAEAIGVRGGSGGVGGSGSVGGSGGGGGSGGVDGPGSGGGSGGLEDPLSRFCADPTGTGAPARSREDLVALAAALHDCRGGQLPPGAQIERLRQALEPLVRRRYDRPEPRLADLDTLARLATSAPTRAALVAELTLDPPSSTGDLAGPPGLDDDWLTLSTVHSAKGGEWDAVHLIHAADGAFPSDLATRDAEGVDEERRLFYVALTRARRHLHVYAPLRYHHGDPAGFGDRHSYAQRTRFLPPSLDGLLEQRAVRSALDGPAGGGRGARGRSALPPATRPATTAVDDRLHDLW
ncbi:MAG TPA: ATP-dependent helicase [Acidimicrobiales bacterium]|nr:ATP-dependent helicase [Acidimicrobiales bacterium]